MSNFTIYHNPRCSKSRQTLELLTANGIEPTIVKYLETPPTVEQLRSILDKLGKSPEDIIRKGESLFKELGLAAKSLDADEWLAVLADNPKLIERPIVVTETKAIVGRPLKTSWNYSVSSYILVLYYSRGGGTRQLARAIARGARANGFDAKLRTVPPLDSNAAEQPEDDDLYCSLDDLANCSGLAMGGPTRFGNMAAPMKAFLDQTTSLWMSGALIDKPATVFTASSSMHGGQESTLLSMMLPLIHHGMVYMGLPYSDAELHNTNSGGTPYGVSHVSGHGDKKLSDDEYTLAVNCGKRLAKIAKALEVMND